MDTSNSDMTQVVLEGVAFALRDVKPPAIDGGGTKSPLEEETIANILNLKVDVIES